MSSGGWSSKEEQKLSTFPEQQRAWDEWMWLTTIPPGAAEFALSSASPSPAVLQLRAQEHIILPAARSAHTHTTGECFKHMEAASNLIKTSTHREAHAHPMPQEKHLK